MKFTRIAAAARASCARSKKTPTQDEFSALAALHLDVTTKSHARKVLMHNGFSGREASVNELLSRIQHISSIRRERRARRSKPGGKASSQRSPAVLPLGTLMERLVVVRKQAVTRAARECLRHGAAGGHSMSVTLTDDPQQVGYTVVVSRNWHTYAGRFKGWAAMEDHHRVCVPTDWRVRVDRRGLAVVGGMFTLDAHALVGHDDIELFQATWVSQGRGYSVNVHRGVIARLNAEVYHAPDVSRAIRGVRLKAQASTAPKRQRVGAYELSVEAFIERYAKHKDVEVSIDDARETGACEYGIRSWCEAVGIDPEDWSVPIGRVLEGFRVRPQVEVRRAVLHAIRVDRLARRHPAASRKEE